ncbi:S-layer homology domain-containing protein [Egicoccus sp. AB-alg6-2]|uniref:S-layer homology domain-containing protein n=1 Tax=Egicoccus sp. AB-alg6-2 TaxID=3242692 RepID=UPI00359E037D
MDVRRRRRAPQRTLALSAVVALTAALAPAALAQTTGPEAGASEERGIERVCPPPGDDGAPLEPGEPRFADAQGTHGDAIECAADYLLVSGFTDGTYRPGAAINRAQMATFVANWVEVATGEELPFDPQAAYFPDIAGGTHVDAIRKLAEAGIVSGRADGSYGPGASVTRGQMARFVANAIDYADTFAVDGSLPPADDTVYFADAVGSAFQADIQRIAGVGIVQGDSSGDYGAARRVTRGQMASFLMRGADYGDREQRWLPTAVIVEFLVPLSGLTVLDDDGRPGQGELAGRGEATITVDAFDGVLEYTIDVSDVSGPFASSGGAAIHLGAHDENGPAVIPLATGAQLDAASDGVVTGVVMEMDVDHRFAELVEDPFGHYVLVTSDGHPDGAVRGQLLDAGEDEDDDELEVADPPGEIVPPPGQPGVASFR